MADARERLRKIRKYRNLSQQTIAGWVGISQAAYSKKEQGRADGFSPDDFAVILEKTEIDARWLFGQKNGPIEEFDLRLPQNAQNDAAGISEIFQEYRALKAATESGDSVVRRIREDGELHDLVKLLIENRGELGRVRGYLERIAEERHTRSPGESPEKRESAAG